MVSEKEAHSAQKIVAWRTEQQQKFGSRLRDERKRLGLSLVEFARRAGIHRNTQTNYETGQREPDEAYYKTIAEFGVSLTYINNEERIEDLPAFAAGLARDIFSRAKQVAVPESMAELFYLFGLNEVHVECGFSYPFDSAQADALVKAAFHQGEAFFEAAEAVAKYSLRMLPSGEELSPQLRAKLILDVLGTYRLSGERPGLGLRDVIALIAEDLIARRGRKADL